MKSGYKHNTAKFGDPAQDFVSRLFWLRQNPNGTNRPDLTSVNGRYTPKLYVEVKGGGSNKGIMVEYQLHYSMQSAADFKRIFGEDSPSYIPNEDAAFYYCIVNRTDKLSSQQMSTPFSSLKITFGDIYMAPGDYCLTAFAVARAVRTGEKVDEVMDELRASMKRNILEGKSHAEETKRKGPQTWQDLHGRDIAAFFYKDSSLTTSEGKRRIELIGEHYPHVHQLQSVQIPGPAQTMIYVLAKPEHTTLIDTQLRKTVTERTPILDEVIHQRAAALPLIETMLAAPAQQMLWQMDTSEADLNHPELPRLTRLEKWLAQGETSFIDH